MPGVSTKVTTTIPVTLRLDEKLMLQELASEAGTNITGIIREMIRSQKHLPFDAYRTESPTGDWLTNEFIS